MCRCSSKLDCVDDFLRDTKLDDAISIVSLSHPYDACAQKING